MKPREAVLRSLRGGGGDRIPFTAYVGLVPRSTAERELRQRGLGLVHPLAVVRTHRPNVQVREEAYWKDGHRFVRTHYQTSRGELTTLGEETGSTTWWHERLFKSPEDYPALEAYLRDTVYEPCYADYVRQSEQFGDDFVIQTWMEREPLQMLISTILMSTEDFCVQWMDNRDEVLKLYKVIVENHRKLYPLVADSPGTIFYRGGNVVPDIVGMKRFEEYYMPHYQETAEILHKKGKLLGSHFDSNCRLLAPQIARSGLDFLEAFTPSPDTDMNVADATAAWPNMALWLNFPSSQHLKTESEIEQITVDLINQRGSANGMVISITEDVPPERALGNYKAIMDGIDRHAREHPDFYRQSHRMAA